MSEQSQAEWHKVMAERIQKAKEGNFIDGPQAMAEIRRKVEEHVVEGE